MIHVDTLGQYWALLNHCEIDININALGEMVKRQIVNIAN